MGIEQVRIQTSYAYLSHTHSVVYKLLIFTRYTCVLGISEITSGKLTLEVDDCESQKEFDLESLKVTFMLPLSVGFTVFCLLTERT